MLTRTFRLLPYGLWCDRDGLSFHGEPLSVRDAAVQGSAKWRPLTQAHIERALSRTYGIRATAEAKLRGMRTVADALNAGEVARAQIAALFLHLPDPALLKSVPDRSAAFETELARCGWLRKDWNPDDHPRAGVPPNPGWFAPKDDAESSGSKAPSASSGSIAPAAENGEQVAVQTTNFNHACRALRLDRNAASDLLHKLKDENGLSGDDNCVFDTETGDVYFNGQLIGNLLEP